MKNQMSNLQPAALVEQTIVNGQGKLSSTGALVVKTGKFTGRSPKDRFIVKDARTEHSVDWGDIATGGGVYIAGKFYLQFREKSISLPLVGSLICILFIRGL